VIEGVIRIFTSAAYGIDDLAVTFGLLFAVIWGLSAIYAWVTLPGRDRARFFGYYLPAAAGGILVAFAADAVSFYFCFALMALPAWGLVAWRSDTKGRRAGILYLIATVIGEALLLAALMVLAAEAGSISLDALRSAMLTSPSGTLAFALIIGAFGLKLGVIGASGFLPLTYGYAPGGAAAALAGATVKVGVLGLLRLLPLGEVTAPEWSTVVVGLGLATAFGAALLGVFTTTPRAVLGYSSASQMGLVLIAVGVGLAEPAAAAPAVAAAVAYSLHHGLAKATLFMGEDVVRAAPGRVRGIALGALVLPAASLVGLPFTSGFAAKYALKDAVHASTTNAAHLAETLLPWAAVGTALLMLRFFQLAVSGASSAEEVPGAARVVYATMVLLVAGAVWVWPAKWVASAAEALTHVSSLWASTWPGLVALALAAAAWRLTRSRNAGALSLVVPGDIWVLAWNAVPALRARMVVSEKPRRRIALNWSGMKRVLMDADATLTVWSIAAGVFVLLAAVLVWVAT